MANEKYLKGGKLQHSKDDLFIRDPCVNCTTYLDLNTPKKDQELFHEILIVMLQINDVLHQSQQSMVAGWISERGCQLLYFLYIM